MLDWLRKNCLLCKLFKKCRLPEDEIEPTETEVQ